MVDAEPDGSPEGPDPFDDSLIPEEPDPFDDSLIPEEPDPFDSSLAVEASPTAQPAARPAPSRNDEVAEAEAPTSVLIVDDDADTRLLARTVLEGRGWVVDEAANGKEALLKVGIPGLSLIVLDLGLPDMDGVEILQTLKGTLHTAGIPVVVLTGRTDRETERQVLLEGADDYIPKPMDPAIFVARTAGALRRHAS